MSRDIEAGAREGIALDDAALIGLLRDMAGVLRRAAKDGAPRLTQVRYGNGGGRGAAGDDERALALAVAWLRLVDRVEPADARHALRAFVGTGERITYRELGAALRISHVAGMKRVRRALADLRRQLRDIEAREQRHPAHVDREAVGA